MMKKTDSLDQQARQAAQSHMGEFAWPTVVLGATVLIAYLSTVVLVAQGLFPVWLGVLLVIPLTYASYTVLHEAAHGSISGSHQSLRWLNELMGYLAGWVMMVPLTAHRHEHLAHHRNTNNPESDPDYQIAGMWRSPWQPIVATVRSLTSQYRYYFTHRWQQGPRSQNVRLCLEVLCQLVPRLAFVAQGYWVEGAALFLVGGLGGVLLTMYLFAYLVHTPHEAEGRYLDTSTIIIPGRLGRVLTLAWGFQNYHSIHHLFPRVPFYRYCQVFDEIEDVMNAKGAPIYQLGSSASAYTPGFRWYCIVKQALYR
jgi:beta-carotene hydroxylase